MHGLDYRLRAIAVANYLASQVVKSDLQGSWPIQSATPTCGGSTLGAPNANVLSSGVGSLPPEEGACFIHMESAGSAEAL